MQPFELLDGLVKVTNACPKRAFVTPNVGMLKDLVCQSAVDVNKSGKLLVRNVVCLVLQYYFSQTWFWNLPETESTGKKFL